MGAGDDRAVVEALVEAFHTKDRAAFDACYADPIVVHASDGTSRTMSHDEHWDEAMAMFDAFPDLRAEIDLAVADGGHVLLRGRYSGTYAGERHPSAVGRRATWAWWCDYRVEDGRIAEAWNCYDDVAMLDQLGLFTPPVPARPDAGSG